ncbi:chymotrypsin-1-like [Atheta coriaria]|uniref:chymotrypsin-1-like n=1 Tax=Dalotia coriaria TaxID=877792 RepID=UPI0031F3CC2C
MVSLRNYGKHWCGASILDEVNILCAAHCIYDQTAPTMTIRVGNNKLSEQTETYQVASIIQHENYQRPSKKNDVAILTLTTPIVFRDGVQPVKLRQSDITTEEVVLSGWGLTSFPGENPDHLQYSTLNTITYEECVKYEEDFVVSETDVCTLDKIGIGACYGDSGSPLVDLKGEQVGITAWGIHGCGLGYPTVFTRVYSYLSWIEDNRK